MECQLKKEEEPKPVCFVFFFLMEKIVAMCMIMVREGKNDNAGETNIAKVML